MPTKPSWEKNSTTFAMASTSTTQESLWSSIRAVTSATDAQKLKHIRIAYSLQQTAGTVKALIELMAWPESQTPNNTEPANQDTQIFVQRPLVGDALAIHYGFLRWPSLIVKPGLEFYIGFRTLSASAGTHILHGSITWLETVV